MKLKRFKVMLCSFFMMFAISNISVSASENIDLSIFTYSEMDTFFRPNEFDYIYYQYQGMSSENGTVTHRLLRYPAGTTLNINLDKEANAIRTGSSVSGLYLLQHSLSPTGMPTSSNIIDVKLETLVIKVFGENPIISLDGEKITGSNGLIEIIPSGPKIMDKISNVQYVINEDYSITYSYDFPTDSDFSHLEIYQDALLLNDNYKLNTITITDLVPEKPYNFKFISVDTSGNKSDVYVSSVVAPIGPDLIAPLDVTEINQVVSGTGIQFTYNLPIDDDFSHLQVWRNNQMIGDNVKITTFNDTGLDYETSYNYVFKSVDFSGNISNGSSLTVKTSAYMDDVAPLSPTGLNVINGNASLSLSWFSNVENDVAGYNVYVDGIKKNGSPVMGNSYRMTNLVNAAEYNIQISAVDTSGNESILTTAFVAVPDASKLPVFKIDSDLTAVAESTENWFSELWLVTAFSASIPIAFIVGNRVKSLFFA